MQEREEPKVSMEHMGVKEHKEVALAREWRMPRAFDPQDSHQHYAKLYDALAPAERRATLSRIAAHARHEAVPPAMQDAICRVITSSLPIGSKTKDWKSRKTCEISRECGAGDIYNG